MTVRQRVGGWLAVSRWRGHLVIMVIGAGGLVHPHPVWWVLLIAALGWGRRCLVEWVVANGGVPERSSVVEGGWWP